MIWFGGLVQPKLSAKRGDFGVDNVGGETLDLQGSLWRWWWVGQVRLIGKPIDDFFPTGKGG